MILKKAPLPEDIVTLGAEEVNGIWKEANLKDVGLKRAKTLFEAAEHSIGSREGATATRLEIRMMLKDYKTRSIQLQKIMMLIESLIKQRPMAEKLLEIKGVDIKTVSGLLAEVSDSSWFNDPKQIQTLGGLTIRENRSGKITISKLGQKRLRYLLFEVAMSLIAKNAEFAQLHQHYTTRWIAH